MENPIRRVRRPRVPKRKSPRLTQEEIGRLLDAVAQTMFCERNLAMVCLMLDSGLRRGEVIGLRVPDVELDRRLVRVVGKDKEEREVPVGPITDAALRAYLAKRQGSVSEELFLSRVGNPLTKDGLQVMIHKLKRAANLPKLRCHLLRHTFANHFIANGGGLRKLQKILGHSDVRTTADLYTDPEIDELVRAHDECSPLAELVVDISAVLVER